MHSINTSTNHESKSTAQNSKHLIVITEKFATEAFAQIQTANVGKLVRLTQISELENYMAEVTVLIIRSKTPITQALLDRAPNLQLIITCTSGFDHINLAQTQQRNICVMYTPEANARSAAELTWGLVMNCARSINEAHKMTKAGVWDRSLLQGQELFGKTYGVIGLGRIGQKVIQFAKAFGMHTVAFDPYQEEHIFQKLNLERSSYEEVLKQSDILSFHVPLTQETENMFNQSHIEYLNKGTIIVNTSRGSVINEDDLCDALDSGQIQKAALDVFAKEPLSRDSRLLKNSKIILTQHIGALTEEAFKKASFEAAEKCILFLTKKLTSNTLPLNNEWESLMFEDQKKNKKVNQAKMASPHLNIKTLKETTKE